MNKWLTSFFRRSGQTPEISAAVPPVVLAGDTPAWATGTLLLAVLGRGEHTARESGQAPVMSSAFEGRGHDPLPKRDAEAGRTWHTRMGETVTVKDVVALGLHYVPGAVGRIVGTAGPDLITCELIKSDSGPVVGRPLLHVNEDELVALLMWEGGEGADVDAL